MPSELENAQLKQQTPCLKSYHRTFRKRFPALFQHLSNNTNQKRELHAPVWWALLLGIQTAFSSHSRMFITQQNTQDLKPLEIHPKVKLHTNFKRKPPRHNGRNFWSLLPFYKIHTIPKYHQFLVQNLFLLGTKEVKWKSLHSEDTGGGVRGGAPHRGPGGGLDKTQTPPRSTAQLLGTHFGRGKKKKRQRI